MALVNEEVTLSGLTIHKFDTYDDFESALNSNLIGENDISFVNEDSYNRFNIPDPTGHDGQVLKSDGCNSYWENAPRITIVNYCTDPSSGV